MSELMRSLLRCSKCGATLPQGILVCPRDGARGVEDNPFSDEATVRRNPSSSRDSTGISRAATVPELELPQQEDEQQRRWEATVSRDIMLGKQLGDYVVKRRIGAGGMGIVYEGEHPIIGRKVAIKILRPEFSEGGARDLIAEARAASSIRHRGIIDVFGFGTIPGVGQYLVMEFLEGLPLDEVIHQRAPMLEVEVVGLLDELLGALAAAHAKGVIHRDLKPGNIFVGTDSTGAESVKVLDFGLAKRSEMPHGTTPQTRSSMIVGTPEYMAPEQACGQPVGPHTDLYSVGVIAFEMLTRRLPFLGASAMEIAIQHVQAQPPPPSQFVDLHPALDALVVRMLAKKAAQRPASADAVRRELKVILRELADGATRLAPGGAPSDEVRGVDPDAYTADAPSRSSRPVADSITATAVPRNSRPVADSVTVTRKTPPPSEMPAVVIPARVSPPTTDEVKAVRPSRRPLFAAVGGLVAVLAGVGVLALRPGASASPGVPPAPPPTVAAGTSEPTPPPAEPVVAAKPEPVVTPTPVPTPPEPVAEQKPPERPAERPGPSRVGRPSTVRPQGSDDVDAGVAGEGTLRLVVMGAWANILIDGKLVGQAPRDREFDLPAGSHKLELKNPGVKTYTKTIIIRAGRMEKHEVEFRPSSATTEEP